MFEEYNNVAAYQLVKELIKKYGVIPSLLTRFSVTCPYPKFEIIHHQIYVETNSEDLFSAPEKGGPVYNVKDRHGAAVKMEQLAKKEDRIILPVAGRLFRYEAEFILKELVSGHTVISKRWKESEPSYFESIHEMIAYEVL